MFRQNVGGVDRVLRLTVGGMFFLAGLFLLTSRTRPGVVLAAVGMLALLTGIIRFCVLYIPFGISTAPPKKPGLTQTCDCAAWMKAMQDNSAAVAPPAPPKEESVEVAAATRGR
jgi:hypothetical protein